MVRGEGGYADHGVGARVFVACEALAPISVADGDILKHIVCDHGSAVGKPAPRFAASQAVLRPAYYAHCRNLPSPLVVGNDGAGAATAEFAKSYAGGGARATGGSAAGSDAVEPGDRVAVAQPRCAHEAAPRYLRSQQSAISSVPDAGTVHGEIRPDRSEEHTSE